MTLPSSSKNRRKNYGKVYLKARIEFFEGSLEEIALKFEKETAIKI